MPNQSIRKGEYYQHPQEVWNEARCRKEANHTAKDGFGTPYPFKGYIGFSQWGKTRYNGGCIRDDCWWEGEVRPLPKVTDGFEIIYVPTWGYRIKKKENT